MKKENTSTEGFEFRACKRSKFEDGHHSYKKLKTKKTVLGTDS